MTDLFFAAIKDYDMLSPGDNVVVGVSGGADSMCLIEALYENREKLGIELKAAHVNHCLRGAESDSDEAFVRAYCEQRGIPLSVLRADINALSAERKESTELCARKVRYDFFASLGCTKTATAHTGSDAVETMLMNLSRGTSLNGLCSIPPVRGEIIRPLIYLTRADTERFCRERGIAYVTDSTNLSDDYTRNRFRHNVIAALKEINPSFETNALRCLASLREDNCFIESSVRTEYEKAVSGKGLDLSVLKDSSDAVVNRVTARYISENSDSDFENRHLKLISENASREHYALVLPGGVKVVVRKGMLNVIDSDRTSDPPESVSVNKNEETDVCFGGYRIKISSGSPRKLYPGEIAVDFSEIDDIITIRSRKEGDMLSLRKRRCTKSLKKLFNELNIPAEKRVFIPVISDKNGVIWCFAGGEDASRAVSENTGKILIIKTECDKNDQ